VHLRPEASLCRLGGGQGALLHLACAELSLALHGCSLLDAHTQAALEHGGLRIDLRLQGRYIHEPHRGVVESLRQQLLHLPHLSRDLAPILLDQRQQAVLQSDCTILQAALHGGHTSRHGLDHGLRIREAFQHALERVAHLKRRLPLHFFQHRQLQQTALHGHEPSFHRCRILLGRVGLLLHVLAQFSERGLPG